MKWTLETLRAVVPTKKWMHAEALAWRIDGYVETENFVEGYLEGSDRNRYSITISKHDIVGQCTCLDHIHHRNACKHIIALAIRWIGLHSKARS